jgi:hypothetical protein
MQRGPVLGLTLFCAAAGCRPVYAPNMLNIPLLKKEGELRATVDPRNLQLAYALADAVGLMANGYARTETSAPSGSEKWRAEGELLEVGAGYFVPAPRGPDWLLLDLYAGGGAGHLRWEITPAGGGTRVFDVDGVRLFAQADCGVTSTFADLAIAVRVVSVQYLRTSAEHYDAALLASDHFAGLKRKPWFFVEPAVTLRLGYKWVKLQIQYGRSLQVNRPELNYDPGIFSIGVTLSLFGAS